MVSKAESAKVRLGALLRHAPGENALREPRDAIQPCDRLVFEAAAHAIWNLDGPHRVDCRDLHHEGTRARRACARALAGGASTRWRTTVAGPFGLIWAG
jgi:hypothetical protein